jgi:DtxR family Mn-dependent transcriptional regulator
MPTLTQEDYLREIYRIAEIGDTQVKSTDLCNALQLSKSTVAQRLKELKERGWIEKVAYGPIQLTNTGKHIAQNLTYKHRLIELYLHKELNIPIDQVHAEAHAWEHAVSDQVIQKMSEKLGHPKICPHGKKLPEFLPTS